MNSSLLILIAAIAGAIAGSFFAWLGKRLIDGPRWRLRTACDQCRRKLEWWELIPVISYLGLGGRCRSCGTATLMTDWAMELLGAMLLGLGAWRFGSTRDFVWWVLFTLTTMLLFYIDLRWMVVPRAFSVVVAFIVLMAQWSPEWLAVVVLSGLLGAIFYFFLYAISRGRWVGDGDVGLGFILGVAAGTPTRLGIALLIAHVAGALVALILLRLKKKNFGDALPLGAFLLPAAWVVILVWGWIA